MSDTEDLAAWLLERIAEVEELDVHLRTCQTLKPVPPGLPAIFGDRFTCNCDIPGWMLAECEAKRKIIALHDHITVRVWRDRSQDFEVCTECGSGSDSQGCTPWPCQTIKLLALPYADRPGYREEWRP